MRLTKTLLTAAIAATMATQAFAGGFAPVVVAPEPVVVVEPEAPRSTFGLLLPLALLGALVAVAVASDDDEDDARATTDLDGDGDVDEDDDDIFNDDEDGIFE